MRLFIRLVAVLVCFVVAGAAYAQESPVKSFPAFGDAFTSRLSPDGTLLATFESGVIHNDEIIPDFLPIRVYDVTRGEPVATLSGEPDYAADVAFSPDGTQLAALYPTGWLHVWTIADGETFKRLPIAPNGNRLVWANETTLAVAAGQLPQVQLWDLNTGAMTALLTQRFTTVAEMREYFSRGVPDGLAAFAVAPDFSRFAASTFYDRIQFWGLDGEVTTIYESDADRPMISIMAIAFTPDGSRLLALHGTENKLLVFDTASGDLISEIETERARGRSLAVSPDSTQAAWLVAPEDEEARIVLADLETGETTDVALPAEDGWTTPMASLFFTHDGTQLILSGRFTGASESLDPEQNPVYLIPLPE